MIVSDLNNQSRKNFLSTNSMNDRKFIHIFSNILDVPVVEETKIANLLFKLLENECYKGQHYFFCLSPDNKTARPKILNFVNQFKDRFTKKFSKIRETSERITNIEHYDFLPQKEYRKDMYCTRYEIQFSIVN